MQEAGACSEISKFPSPGWGVVDRTGRGQLGTEEGATFGWHGCLALAGVQCDSAEGYRTLVPAEGWWRGPRPQPPGSCSFCSGIGAPPGCA